MDLMTKYLNQNCLKILSERFIENVKNRFNLLERLRVIKCNENKLIEQTRIYKKKLRLFNFYIFATQYCRPLIF